MGWGHLVRFLLLFHSIKSNTICRDALERATAYPSDRSSVSRSPVPSVRSVRSLASIPGSSASGSSTTQFVPPLASIPDIPAGDNNLSQRSSVAPRHVLLTTAQSLKEVYSTLLVKL